MSSAIISAPSIPSWATAFGQDEYGYFADWSVRTGEQDWVFISQRMRWVPPGEFTMGSPTDEHARSPGEIQRQVVLSEGFWLGDTVVSQELWKALLGQTPSLFSGDELPVETVSWNDVQEFLRIANDQIEDLSLSLPTEAQWEYGCRAGTIAPFAFGETIGTDQCNFDGNYPYRESDLNGEYRGETVFVKTFSPNRWGLFQMHGNVWEWCQDWYGEYEVDELVDPQGPESGSRRVLRGGSWLNYARNVRAAARNAFCPDYRLNFIGFRCLSSAQPSPSEGAADQAVARDEQAE